MTNYVYCYLLLLLLVVVVFLTDAFRSKKIAIFLLLKLKCWRYWRKGNFNGMYCIVRSRGKIPSTQRKLEMSKRQWQFFAQVYSSSICNNFELNNRYYIQYKGVWKSNSQMNYYYYSNHTKCPQSIWASNFIIILYLYWNKTRCIIRIVGSYFTWNATTIKILWKHMIISIICLSWAKFYII